MSEPLRIAVADDEPDIRDYYARILPRMGHRVVVVAASGTELLARSQTARPELIITDVKMPDMDGVEAAARLCRDENIPVILVSADHEPGLIRSAENRNVVGYLVKPIRQSDLGRVIAQAVARFEQLREAPNGDANGKGGQPDERPSP